MRRLLQLVPVLLFVSLIVFFVFRIVPGDAATIQLGQYADPASLKALRHAMGLDKPIYVQYFIWLNGVLHGDLGRSYINHQAVASLVLEKFPATLELALLGTLLSLVISVPLAIVAALYRGRWVDQLTRFLALLGFCTPRYWLAVLLILLLAVHYRWLPPAGYTELHKHPLANLRYALLPVLALGLTMAAIQMRFLRSSLLDVIGADYVRSAYAKGLSRRAVVLRHAVKAALIPFVTVLGLQFAELIGGLVVLEQIFSWPGVSWLMIESISERDFAVVQGAVLLIATAFVTVNLIIDVGYAYLDPRIRYT
ncbi:MAG: ABC transporter permease [Chloroflexota bacterium]